MSPERLGDEPTLATVVDALWEELSAGRPVACPLCHGEMRPADGPHALAIAGRCGACGCSLS
jgi:hypothetical protein